MNHPNRERGASLLFSLMALIVMSLAAVAVARSVGSGVLIIGNLGFKQDATAASAAGTDQAITWLQGNIVGGLLDNDQADKGYYATSNDMLDATGNRTSSSRKMAVVKWNGSCPASSSSYLSCDMRAFSSPTKVNGNNIQWVITRLCANAGPPDQATNPCVRPPLVIGATSTERGEVMPSSRFTQGGSSPFYRVIVRVDGPRNTVSYTESLIHF